MCEKQSEIKTEKIQEEIFNKNSQYILCELIELIVYEFINIIWWVELLVNGLLNQLGIS